MTDPSADTADTADTVRDELHRLLHLPYGLARTAAAEGLVARADALADPGPALEARLALVTAYVFGGEPGKAFTPFAAALAAHDRGVGDERTSHELHWEFKNVLNHVRDFPEVPRERLESLLDEMDRRYRTSGHTPGPVHRIRGQLAAHLGDAAGAERELRLGDVAPTGEMTNCAGCEPTERVELLAWLGRDEEAVAAADGVLLGELTCTEQPHAILTALLGPYLRVGRLDDAARAHRRAYRQLQGQAAKLAELADHLLFCALTGNDARGLEIVERHVDLLPAAPSPWQDMRFCAAAARVLTRVAEAGHGDATVRRNGDATTVAALGAELADRARTLAARFDARNGTGEQGRRVEEILAAPRLVAGLPLSGPAPSTPPEPEVASAPEPVAEDVPDDLSDDPDALLELAGKAPDAETLRTILERFDAVCPDPQGSRLGRRLTRVAQLAAGADEAADTLERAVAVFAEAGDRRRELQARQMRATARSSGGHDDGPALMAEAADAMRAAGERVDEVRARWVLAEELIVGHGAIDDAAEHLERAVAVLDELDGAAGRDGAGGLDEAPERDVARVRVLLGRIRLDAGDPAGALAVLTPDPMPTSPAHRGPLLDQRGRAELDDGRPADAVTTMQDALADLDTVGDVRAAAYLRVMLADALLLIDAEELAAEAAEDAARELAPFDEEEAGAARHLLGLAQWRLGEREAALALFDGVADEDLARGAPERAAQVLSRTASLLDGADRDAEAADRHQRAAAAFDSAGQAGFAVFHRGQAALSWAWAGDPDAADEALAAADAAATEVDDPHIRTILDHDASRALSALSRWEAALARIAPVAASLRSLGDPDQALNAEAVRARALAALNRTDEAHAVLDDMLAALDPEDPRRPGVDDLRARLIGG